MGSPNHRSAVSRYLALDGEEGSTCLIRRRTLGDRYQSRSPRGREHSTE